MDKRLLRIGVGPPVYGDAARGLPSGDYLIGIAAETLDIGVDPFNDKALIAQAQVGIRAGGTRKSKDVEAIVC